MPLPTYSRWPAVWDTLYQQLVTETGAGGRLSTVKTVTHTQYPSAANQYPAVGVQFVKSRWEVVGQRSRREHATFAIVGFTIATPTDSAADALEAAVLALRPIVNDGIGNGLEPILNGVGQYLNPYSARTEVTDVEYDLLPTPDQQSQAIAYARFFLDVTDQVSSNG